MVNLAHVKIWGEMVGYLFWREDNQTATFEYTPEFKRLGLDLSPIVMPLTSQRVYSFSNISRETFLGLPGLFADSLPDAYGKALLDRWLASNGRNFANPVERLCYQGKRSMGALEFEPAHNDYLETSSNIEIDSLVATAREVLNQREAFSTNMSDTKEALINIIKVGTSAGGQRAKAIIAYNDTTKEVRSGQIDAPEGFEHWLLKLDGVTNNELGDPQHYGKIEYIYHLLAKETGINMAECRLLEENGRAHFMTKRFDRHKNDKIHMQTLCGIAHYDYKMLRAYSYEQAFQIMRRLRLPYNQAEEMYRRMVFNVVARNQDDHTKNISFLMNRTGKWSLSPAYDVSWAYNPQGDWTSKHQMSINNKWDDITREDLVTVAQNMNIKHHNEIIEQVTDAVSHWRKLATEYEIPEETIRQIEQSLQLQL
ncbi:MAG: type II toxin-antitoxin system HipA family toxin [Paludibacteraceae bacterium]|nr:type II toxin-antitoxin system HipA family toxin [Paludibacteraceae bacterium]MBO5345506.1 type II toxin-antitoxin system HipA family toxin [Paludibacteraceae bacterium]